MKSEINDALAWFDKNLKEQRIGGAMILSILTYGKWRPGWKQDLVDRNKLESSQRVDAILSLYEDVALMSFSYLKHMGLYMEVSKDEIKPIRLRMVDAGFKDVTVLADDNQRYILARKQGR